MTRDLTSAEMRAIEDNSEYLGVSRLQLMENAGKAVADRIRQRAHPGAKVAIYAGTGGNGGDGFVAARHLSSMGFKVTVVLVGRSSDIRHESTLKNWHALQRMVSSVKIVEASDSTSVPSAEGDVVIDALLGTGTVGAPREPILSAIRVINSLDSLKVAIDLPSGLDADTGLPMGEAVTADLTITFHRSKIGFGRTDKRILGELMVEGIGIPVEAETYAGPGDVLKVRKPRPPDSHKGDFGRLLVVGGSETYFGAPAFVALSALRVGVDLVYVAAPHDAAMAVSSYSPDIITIKLKGERLSEGHLPTIESALSKVDAVVIGPGLGLDDETVRAVTGYFQLEQALKKPTVVDADALKISAKIRHWRLERSVLTPHAGEFAILTGKHPADDMEERSSQVRKAAFEKHATVLLKGPVDVISDGDLVRLNRTHNPGMTVGGTGDVLSGVVGGLVAHGFGTLDSAVAGAFVNGAAGDLAVKEKGYHITASDLIGYIPAVLDRPSIHEEVRGW